jgi:hypothetical protein
MAVLEITDKKGFKLLEELRRCTEEIKSSYRRNTYYRRRHSFLEVASITSTD